MIARPLKYHNSLILTVALTIFLDSVNITFRSVSCERCFPSEMEKSENLAAASVGLYSSPLYGNLKRKKTVL